MQREGLLFGVVNTLVNTGATNVHIHRSLKFPIPVEFDHDIVYRQSYAITAQ
ncbi:hypothetical protein GCM10007047_19480 [Cerasicoccus arenae]|uniref:Uncharacterized protein n=1 Tax=Cerasicoccus arenae TaxID=424488 RepID=A0A8J3GEE9_9BACT|nr:hypothetical protein GCM10007047_19480 [Cerasicoccus arenae]